MTPHHHPARFRCYGWTLAHDMTGAPAWHVHQVAVPLPSRPGEQAGLLAAGYTFEFAWIAEDDRRYAMYVRKEA